MTMAPGNYLGDSVNGAPIRAHRNSLPSQDRPKAAEACTASGAVQASHWPLAKCQANSRYQHDIRPVSAFELALVFGLTDSEEGLDTATVDDSTQNHLPPGPRPKAGSTSKMNSANSFSRQIHAKRNGSECIKGQKDEEETLQTLRTHHCNPRP